MTTRQSRRQEQRPKGKAAAERLLKSSLLAALEKKFSSSVTEQLPWDLLGCLAQNLDIRSPIKTSLQEVVKKRDVLSYLSLPSRPKQLYGSAEEYFQEAIVLNLLKKYPFGTLEGVDPEASAMKTFYAAELQCRRTNRRLRYYRERYFRLAKNRIGVDTILHSARQLIAQLIGHSPKSNLEEIRSSMSHGPGGVLDTEDSTRTTFYYKVNADRYSVTPGCYPYAIAAILSDQRWRQMVWADHYSCSALSVPPVADSREAVIKRLDVFTYNKVVFVPKTAKTHRVIAAEPMMNMFCQKGVGRFLRTRLKRVGINLDSQVRNQHLAYLGSRQDIHRPSSRPCTLDLASASDTLAIELVRELLPPDWFDMLNDLRCPQGKLKGRLIFYEKFASMGNGFTFELETLIFWSLCVATAAYYQEDASKVSVYGDDIIVPANIALACIEVLDFCGFKTNKEKSFVFGPFRESCGKDYFEGFPVRPFYLKEAVQDARSAIYVANSIACLRNQDGNSFDDTRDLSAYKTVIRHIPKIIREHLLGPRVEALDSHIFCSFDTASRSRLVKWNRDYHCYEFPAYAFVAEDFRGRLAPRYLQFIHASAGFSNFEIFHPKLLKAGVAYNLDFKVDERLTASKYLLSGWSFVHRSIQKVSNGTSASTVTRRGRVRPTLNVLLTERWDPTVTAFDVAVMSG